MYSVCVHVHVPWIVEDTGECVSEKGLYFEGIAVLKTGRSLGVVHHQANGIREHTRLRLQGGHVTVTCTV